MSNQKSLDDLNGSDAEMSTLAEEMDLPSNWSVQYLEDVCEIGGGSTPKRSNDEYWDGGDILWATPKDFDGPWMVDTEEKMTEAGAEASTSQIYDNGTVLLVVRSGVLRHTLPVAKVVNPTTVNQDIKALQPNEDVIHPEYLFQYLYSQSERIRVRCKKTGTTVESIQTSVLKKYPVPVPPMEDQVKIAGISHNLDLTTQRALELAEQSKTVKQGLIEDLLSGEARTDGEEIVIPDKLETYESD